MTEKQKILFAIEVLEKFSLGWLYWPAKKQIENQPILYESQRIDKIEELARGAIRRLKK